MRRTVRLARILPVIVALPFCAAALHAQETTDPADRALSLAVREAGLPAPRVVVLKTRPPGFDLMVTTELPAAGYAVDVDAIEIRDGERRIVARGTARPPEGMAAQVLTATTLRLPLGPLDRGRWFLELWMRQGETAAYEPADAWVLEAR